MTTGAIEPSQRTTAKVVGILYLFLMVTGIFAEFYARGRLIVPADAGPLAQFRPPEIDKEA